MTRRPSVLFLLIVGLVPCSCVAWAPRVDVLSLASHVGAAVTASAEIYEDVESVGHGHGMLLLCGSRLCRELNVLREAAVEQVEDLEPTALGKVFRKPFHVLLSLLSSQVVTMVLALAGLAAALVEVLQDSRPGGHHGAVFLAVNELFELLQEARIARGRLLRLIQNRAFRLTLTGGATMFALMETVRSVGSKNMPGAHHGVLILALSQTLRCIGLLRGQLKVKEA